MCADNERLMMKTIEEYQKFGDELLRKYHLDSKGWTFVISHNCGSSSTALGMCNYKYKKLFLKHNHALHNTEEKVIDTILHEVAHALAGPGAGHGPLWKRYARIVGADPTATKAVSTEYRQASYKYQLAFKKEDGTIETFERYAQRRSDLAGVFVRNRKETKDKLFWKEL